MEYLKLQDLQNQYPSAESYKSRVKDFITLEGQYPSKNKIDFKISPINEIKLDDIQTVEGISFRFLLLIKNKSNDRSGVYYTSPQFKKDLVASLNEPNPYFISDALKKEFIVEYILEDVVKAVVDYRKDEVDNFSVTVNKHFFINLDNTIDYTKLLKYIDFVVSTPKTSEISTKGTISSKELLPKGTYKIKELKLKELPKLDLNAGKGDYPFTGTQYPSGQNTTGGGGGNASGGGGSGYGDAGQYTYNPNQPGGGYGGRPGDATTSNPNYTGNQQYGG